ncbi:DUF805 domain-containing protein [Asticcacaulis sp. ZE23SCel15]|uniref:DUF805 domain-containing protein n=1 Tax=Asticcacaulis sp. ZE23SCel15 TaxID=3059027 RepID=UPI0026601E6F|nr:DUF805 domain-containing protein [Asticcacaulis sp. ZE23SCel15]WKL56145.1 DUF805 domain-containing protein [Asticcacaulis sp. ZE23SCel15]
MSALKFLFSTQGRVTRLPFILFVVGLRLVTEIAHYFARNQDPSTSIIQYSNVFAIIGVVGLIALWPVFAITVKRLHDMNLPAVLALGHFIPFPLGFLSSQFILAQIQSPDSNSALFLSATQITMQIVYFYILALLLVLSLVKGTKGQNRYGSDPLSKGGGAEAAF